MKQTLLTADFSNLFDDFEPRITADLTCALIPWGLAPKALINWGTDGLLQTRGNAVLGAAQKYIDFQKDDGETGAVLTEVPETVAMTWYFLARGTDTNDGITTRPQFVTSRSADSLDFPGNVVNGFGLAVGNGVVSCAIWDHTTGAARSATVAVAAPNTWRVYVATTSAAEIRIDDVLSETFGTRDVSGDQRSRSSLPLQIGGPVNINSGSCQIGAAIGYSAAHDSVTRAAMAADMVDIGQAAGLLD